MIFSDKFISAGHEINELTKNVPAPYFRKSFRLDDPPRSCAVSICGLGFYRLWINGREITKGLLAPYISNPADLVYYDEYDLTPFVSQGRNCIGVQLGNGLLNNPGGFVWDFEEATWRSAPKLAFAVSVTSTDGAETVIEADESVRVHDSPLYFDDLRCGERYDARLEIDGWNLPDFDDSGWVCAVPANAPLGERQLCLAPPVVKSGEILRPASVFPGRAAPYIPDYKKKIGPVFEFPDLSDGYIFDFGENRTGVPHIRFHGDPGQRLELQFAEYVDNNGELNYANHQFYPNGFVQRVVLICSGREDEFEPRFSYYGASCCLITGLREEQVPEMDLSFHVCSSRQRVVGGFSCSDPIAEQLFRMCLVSDQSNFIYFPNDCPHREKNGWTGDAALSSQRHFMLLDCYDSIREWLCQIRKAQRADGCLPGIVPTSNWGYDAGPSWDIVLTELTYRAYRARGELAILRENADAIDLYLDYALSQRNEKGLVAFGLGDWCSVDWKQNASRDFTATVTVMDICRKAAYIFNELGQTDRAARATAFRAGLRDAVRREYVDPDTCIADSRCQTSQAMALYYGVFDPEEEAEAFRVLLRIIHENDDFLDVGILGARVLFHVLCAYGEAALAYSMITRPEWPSYGHFIKQGLTSLPEEFVRDDGKWSSRNHHMFGDIANFFISRIAGLRYKPDVLCGLGFGPSDTLVVRPAFIRALREASAFQDCPFGRIRLKWSRSENGVLLELSYPKGLPVSPLPDRMLQRDGGSTFLYRKEEESDHGGENDTELSVRFSETEFRPMRRSDRRGVEAFFREMGPRSVSFFNVNHGNEKRVMEFFENGKTDHRFFVADMNGSIVSVAFIWDLDRSVPWFGIAVRDDVQRKGIGRTMLRHVFAFLRDGGYGGLLLRTASENAAARGLYEKCGFEHVGVHPSGELLYLRRFRKEDPLCG